MNNLSKTFSLSACRKQSGKLTTPLLVLLAIFLFGRPAEAQYGGGTGEPNDPYLIYTAEQMNVIGLHEEDWDKHFILMADIDLAGYTGTDFNIIGIDWNNAFTGVFDGNGKTVSNFSYISADTDYIGLFAYVADPNAEIKDLGLVDPNVDAGAGSYVGSLAGWFGEGTITDCHVVGGNISGKRYVGGLVGNHGAKYEALSFRFALISNSYSTASVSGKSEIGGLVGYMRPGSRIVNCRASGSVSGSGSYVGGLVGSNVFATITCSYATSTVTGDDSVGGLAGYNENMMTYCYATGSVSGTRNVGGLVGSNYLAITNCYSSGDVSGTWTVGGLVGENWGVVMDSFWDTQTSGQSTSAGGTGKTTAEMQEPNTFMDSGWDFVGAPDGPTDIWAEPFGGGYPILWWQLSPLPQLPFSGGTGELDDPYLISTADELNSIGHNPRLMNGHFKLINDIDLGRVGFFIIGSRWHPYRGVFDGSGHTISNFTYIPPDANGIGLFGYARWPAQIKDLGLITPNVDAGTGRYIGLLAGLLGEGTITNCYVVGGTVSGSYEVGGLVGYNVQGTMTNCYAKGGSVSGTGWFVGGLIGGNDDGRITNCYASGTVAGDTSVGGLVGGNDGTITNCYATSSVSGNERVGGLLGANNGRITNCYSTGSVSGNQYVGGLVGRNYGAISNCYATDSVTGTSNVGGLVGDNNGTISNCYSVGAVPGWAFVGGLVGGFGGPVYNSFWDVETSGQWFSAGGTGKTTAEMQTESTFTGAGWDFVGESVNGTEDIWWILESQDYPRLSWEFIEGDSTALARNRLAGPGIDY